MQNGLNLSFTSLPLTWKLMLMPDFYWSNFDSSQNHQPLPKAINGAMRSFSPLFCCLWVRIGEVPPDQGTGSFIDIRRPFALNSEGTLSSDCSSDIKVLGSILDGWKMHVELKPKAASLMRLCSFLMSVCDNGLIHGHGWWHWSYNWCLSVTLTFPRRHLCEPTGPCCYTLRWEFWFPINRESILWNVALWTHLHMFKELMTRGHCSLVAGLNHHSILVESGLDAAMSLWWWRNSWWKCKLWHLHHPPKIIRWLSCFQRALNQSVTHVWQEFAATISIFCRIPTKQWNRKGIVMHLKYSLTHLGFRRFTEMQQF